MVGKARRWRSGGRGDRERKKAMAALVSCLVLFPASVLSVVCEWCVCVCVRGFCRADRRTKSYSSMSLVSSSEKSLMELSLLDDSLSCSRNASSVANLLTYS